jgi:hypothetical protein
VKQESQSNATLKAEMINKHRAAFYLWGDCHKMLEELAVKDRDLAPPLVRALDILFLEAFKSHGSLYPLCVMGHGEDAATIARRLFEIALQVGYITSEPSSSEDRAKRYLARFWLEAEERLKKDIPASQREYWQDQYDRHKHLLLNSKGKPFRNWWGDSTFADLAEELGVRRTYDEDYRFLSRIAHCAAPGILIGVKSAVINIKTDFLVREILVFGTRYILGILERWNEHFRLADPVQLDGITKRALEFDFASN